MRKRINRRAICSSDNYSKSKKLHMEMLEERHSHFSGIAVSGEISIDQPVVLKSGKVLQRYKTIRVFGKDMKVTIEEYNTHCKSLKF